MIILGIDPGYGRLGYALLKKNEEGTTLLDYSCIETSKDLKYHERFLKLSEKIEKLLKKYKPEVAAIEKIYFTKNQKTAFAVAEVRGMLLYLMLKNKIKIEEYTPLEVKSAVCGYGKATKEQIKKMVTLILNIKKEPKIDDISDAIAIALICSNHIHKFSTE